MIVDTFVVLVAWLAVWAAGIVVVFAWRGSVPPANPGELSWSAGAGFLVGAFGITVWLRALSLVHVPFGRIAVFGPVVLIIVAGIVVARRRSHVTRGALVQRVVTAVSGRDLAGASRWLWLALLAWLAVRYALLWLSMIEQPLYPWDAWIQWATKAHVWFATRSMVPFVEFAPWLAADGAAYTDAAPGYPATVSLLQVVSSIALGHWDDARMNVPWWLLSIALPLATYGYLRQVAFERVVALACAAVIATLPLVNMHVALAGYADLPMAAYYCVAALAVLRWIDTRTRFDAGIAVVLAVALPTIKTPGIVWLATLVVPLVIALLPRFGMRLVLAGCAAALLMLLVLAQTSPVLLNYQLHLDFAPAWSALFDSVFMLGSWNILWYAVVAAAVIGARDMLRPSLAPFTLLVVMGALFLFFVFTFTNARAWVENQTTVNRALLHFAPLAAIWAMVTIRAWAERQRRRTDAPAPLAA